MTIAALALTIFLLSVALFRTWSAHAAEVARARRLEHQRDVFALALVEVLSARRPTDLKVKLMAASSTVHDSLADGAPLPTWLEERLRAFAASPNPLHRQIPVSFSTSDPPPSDDEGGEGEGGAGGANGVRGGEGATA